MRNIVIDGKLGFFRAIEAQSATRLQGRDGSPVDYFDNYHPLDEVT